MENTQSRAVLSAGLPAYSKARAFLEATAGLDFTKFQTMANQIWSQRGSPQVNMDWSDPSTWISERLSGEDQKTALHIWKQSQGLINPRYTYDFWNLTSRYNLLICNAANIIEITQEGQTFLKEPEGQLVADIDQKEGIFNLLVIISEHNPGKRSEILPDWAQFCNTYTTYESDSVHKGSLHDRLINLIDRGFVTRSGILYSITDSGQAYLQKHVDKITGRSITTQQSELQRLARAISQEARDQLAEFLANMDPYKFEHLVRLLLEEMGYTNVMVTAPSNDKGVDVMADIELGISSVREVVQVKRHSGSITRPVLDQLRGSLHRFKAMRGTIITTGTYSPGAKTASFEQNAAPITLIDGDRLIDLLLQYEIGVAKKSVEFFEFDKSKLQQFESEE